MQNKKKSTLRSTQSGFELTTSGPRAPLQAPDKLYPTEPSATFSINAYSLIDIRNH